MKKKQVIPALVIFFMVVGQVFGQLKTNEVGQRTLAYEDNGRNRKLTTEVWYPTLEKAAPEDASPFIRMPTKRDAPISQGIFPLILFSHGTGGGRLTVEWFCAGLASKGFIVAAVDHFGNTFDNPIPDGVHKILGAPAGHSFCVGSVVRLHDISTHLDVNKIGAAGFHSADTRPSHWLAQKWISKPSKVI